jgi:hypothetical protein
VKGKEVKEATKEKVKAELMDRADAEASAAKKKKKKKRSRHVSQGEVVRVMERSE